MREESRIWLSNIYQTNKFETCIVKSVKAELVYMQYSISDSQALFWCFVLIILRMDILDTLLLCSVGQQA